MAARVSTSLSQGPPPGGVEASVSAGPRVVSVSPRLVNAEDHEASESSENLRFPAIEIMRADHRASDALVSLIEIARQTAVGLRELIEDGRASERKTTRSALHLQERLRLSARMMQAFQLQIQRLEKGLADLREQERSMQCSQQELAERLGQMHADAKTVFAEADRRLAEIAHQTREVNSSAVDQRPA